MTSPSRVAFLASTTGLGALASGTLFHIGPGWGVLSAAALGWSALATSGVLLPRLQMFGSIVCRGPEGEQRVALTFDDGPDERVTPRLLDLLAQAGAKATFFPIAPRAAAQPGLIARMLAEGHTVGLHCDEHVRYSEREIPRPDPNANDKNYIIPILVLLLGTLAVFAFLLLS
jgi:hypothetical protein